MKNAKQLLEEEFQEDSLVEEDTTDTYVEQTPPHLTRLGFLRDNLKGLYK